MRHHPHHPHHRLVSVLLCLCLCLSAPCFSKPVLLLSFAGSGNTWTRKLLEESTGGRTGSVYNDKSLSKVLPGELRCDYDLIAVKSHLHVGVNYFFSNHSNGVPAGLQKCEPILPFTSVIILVRHPINAAVAEATRRLLRSHVAGFDEEAIRDAAGELTSVAAAQIRHWGRSYAPSFRRAHSLAKRATVVKYENLADVNTREQALRRITRFVVQESGHAGATTPVSQVFAAADHPDVHRKHRIRVLDYLDHQALCDAWLFVEDEASVYGYEAPEWCTTA